MKDSLKKISRKSLYWKERRYVQLDGDTDGRTYIMKVMGNFRDYGNASKRE
jgi:hypothetical protein